LARRRNGRRILRRRGVLGDVVREEFIVRNF